MNVQKITNFLFEISSLRRLTRSHRLLIQQVSDNIADHSFRVAIIGMMLAKLEGCDENIVLKMCLFYDLPEARTGDANHLNKRYVQMDEERALKDQMDQLPIEQDILKIVQLYEERTSPESIVAKDADLLDQMILQQEYLHTESDKMRWQEYTEKSIKTESAKKIAAQIKQANPLDWLYAVSDSKK